MNWKLFLIVLLPITVSCSDTTVTDTFLFTIPVDTVSEQKVADPNEPPPPPIYKLYYTAFNFIVDSSGNLFFFQRQMPSLICGTGLDENAAPAYIDLRPTDIVAVPKEGLRSFVDLNIFTHPPDDRIVAIGLLKNKIQSEELYKLTQLLKDTSKKARWFIRKATQEESIVLDYKKKLAKFYPEDIHWDSTKTRFPPKLEITDFTPPKIEE